MSSMRRYQQPSDTSYNWSKYNPVLLLGEIGYETDTGKFKIGNGHSTWEDIEYFSSGEAIAGITVDTEKQCIVSDLLNSSCNNGSIVIGSNSNAGYSSIILGSNSNVQSGTIAIGQYINAASNNQTVIGRYNVIDTENKYAYIFADGNSDGNRKNLHTIDHNGVAYFDGKVTVNVNSIISNDNDLITKQYHDNSIKDFVTKDNLNNIAGITVDVNKQTIISDLLGATTNQYSSKSISLGVNAEGSMQSIAIGELATAQFASVSMGLNSKSLYGGVSIGNACNTNNGAVAIGFHTMSKNNSIALGTGIITGDNQVVLGKYNIEDTENKYAYILGDGNGIVNSDGTFSNRVGKNLHTIDHNGNAHFLGKVSIDSNVSILDDGDEYVLVTKKFVQEYVNNAIQNAIGNIMNGDNVAY